MYTVRRLFLKVAQCQHLVVIVITAHIVPEYVDLFAVECFKAFVESTEIQSRVHKASGNLIALIRGRSASFCARTCLLHCMVGSCTERSPALHTAGTSGRMHLFSSLVGSTRHLLKVMGEESHHCVWHKDVR